MSAQPKKPKSPPRKRHGMVKRVRLLSPQHDEFCVQYKLTGGDAQLSATLAGLNPTQGYRLLKRADILARIKEVDKELSAEKTKETVAKFQVTREILDKHLVRRIAGGKNEIAVAVNLKTGYQSLGIIQSGSQTTIKNQQQQAMLMKTNGTFYDVYKAKWLVKKEAEMAKRAEAEHDTPTKQLSE